MENVVSLHPYFNVNEGQLDAFKALMPQFVERTAKEEGCLYYDFTLNGDEVHCREAYAGAEAALAHVEHVGDLLEQAMAIGTLARLELHGPSAELAKLEEGFADLNPVYFHHVCGIGRCGAP